MTNLHFILRHAEPIGHVVEGLPETLEGGERDWHRGKRGSLA